MHPDIREIFHELRQHKEELVRAIEKEKTMSQALTQATADLATASTNLKAQVDNAITYIQSVPNLIQKALDNAANDADAVAAVNTVISQLKSEGDTLSSALQSPPPAPVPAPVTPPATPTAS